MFGLAVLAFLKKHRLLHKKAIKKNLDRISRENFDSAPVFHCLTMWSVKVAKKFLGGNGRKLEKTNKIIDYINGLSDVLKEKSEQNENDKVVKENIVSNLKSKEVFTRESVNKIDNPIVSLENLQNYSPNEIINVKGDGNCLFRCFARIVYGNEGEHNKIRSQICDEFEKNQGI